MRALAVAISAALVGAPPALAQPDAYALPDPTMTPGAVDASVTLDQICNGTTRSRRHVSPGTRAAVMSAYNMPPITTEDIELDHLVPLALGGANTAANLWPQPAPDYGIKDRLEVEMQRRACVAYRTLTPAEAAEVLRQEQREIADDWPAAARRYLAKVARQNAGEMAWRENNRGVSNGAQYLKVTDAALNAPISRQWKGYWQGSA